MTIATIDLTLPRIHSMRVFVGGPMNVKGSLAAVALAAFTINMTIAALRLIVTGISTMAITVHPARRMRFRLQFGGVLMADPAAGIGFGVVGGG